MKSSSSLQSELSVKNKLLYTVLPLDAAHMVKAGASLMDVSSLYELSERELLASFLNQLRPNYPYRRRKRNAREAVAFLQFAKASWDERKLDYKLIRDIYSTGYHLSPKSISDAVYQHSFAASYQTQYGQLNLAVKQLCQWLLDSGDGLTEAQMDTLESLADYWLVVNAL
jgi:hypothetical protein